MLRLFSFLWHGCFHKYDLLEEVDITEERTYGTVKVAKVYRQRCDKCGKIKMTKLDN